MTTTQEELEAVYRQLLPMIRRQMKQDQLTPQAVVIDQEQKWTIIAMPFRDAAEKKLLMKMVDQKCAELQARGLIFFSETWTVQMKINKGEDKEAARARLPDDLAEAPGRVEALMAIMLMHGCHQGYITEFTRAGDVVTFGGERPMRHGEIEQSMFRYFRRLGDLT